MHRRKEGICPTAGASRGRSCYRHNDSSSGNWSRSRCIRGRRRRTHSWNPTAKPEEHRRCRPLRARGSRRSSKMTKTPSTVARPKNTAPNQAMCRSCDEHRISSGFHCSADACSGSCPVEMACLMFVAVGEPGGRPRSFARARTTHHEYKDSEGHPENAVYGDLLRLNLLAPEESHAQLQGSPAAAMTSTSIHRGVRRTNPRHPPRESPVTGWFPVEAGSSWTTRASSFPHPIVDYCRHPNPSTPHRHRAAETLL